MAIGELVFESRQWRVCFQSGRGEFWEGVYHAVTNLTALVA
jgi:hypothetical protein